MTRSISKRRRLQRLQGPPGLYAVPFRLAGLTVMRKSDGQARCRRYASEQVKSYCSSPTSELLSCNCGSQPGHHAGPLKRELDPIDLRLSMALQLQSEYAGFDQQDRQVFVRLKRSFLTLAASLSVQGCAPGQPAQRNFSFSSAGKSLKEVSNALSAFASANGYALHHQTLAGPSRAATSEQWMLEGNGIRMVVLSALMETCQAKEGRRDVEYSTRVFDVSVFSTWWFSGQGRRDAESIKFTSSISRNGMREVTRTEVCSLL